MAKNQNIPGWPEMPSITGSASHLNNPFTNGLAGGMDFIKNFWSNSASGVPGLVVPTIDLQELEKRIKDLKAVEGWLDVNINMLRTTIQALEVQHSTIATIHALSDSMSASTADATKSMMDSAAASSVAYSASLPTTAPTPEPTKSRQRKSKEQANSGLPPGWPTSSATPAPQTKKTSKPKKEAPAVKAKPVAKKVANKSAAPAESGAANAAEQAAASAGAWMNFLQDQFKQVAMKSIPPAVGTESKAAGTKAAAKKPASKTAAKSKK